MEALVTGGAQGIGYQIVESLINDGFSVTVFDINPETLSKAKTSFGCKVFEVDVSIESDVKQALSQLHTLDVLINNAGIWKPEFLKSLDIATQKTVWETNVIGTLNCTKHALPILQQNDSSCIINLTSCLLYTSPSPRDSR